MSSDENSALSPLQRLTTNVLHLFTKKTQSANLVRIPIMNALAIRNVVLM
jgi:hypothetical protein